MDILGKFIGIVFVVLCVLFCVICIVAMVEQSNMDSECRNLGYFDSVIIHGHGWYCVGLSEQGQVYIVEFVLVNKER